MKKRNQKEYQSNEWPDLDYCKSWKSKLDKGRICPKCNKKNTLYSGRYFDYNIISCKNCEYENKKLSPMDKKSKKDFIEKIEKKKQKSKKSGENPFSLKIEDEKVSETIKTGAGIGILLAIFNLIMFLAIGPIWLKLDLISIIIGVIFSLVLALLSLGVYFKNKISSILLLIVYIVDGVLSFVFTIINMDDNEINSLIVGIIIRIFIFFIFLRSTKAIFIYHEKIKKHNKEGKTK